MARREATAKQLAKWGKPFHATAPIASEVMWGTRSVLQAKAESVNWLLSLLSHR